LLILAAASLNAEQPDAWDYRPLVSYEDESLIATMPATAAGGWHLEDASAADTCMLNDGQLRIQVTPQGHDRVRVVDGRGHGQALCFIRPGLAKGLVIGTDGMLQCDGIAAILVLSRLEAYADRRWSLLRNDADLKPMPCAAMLPAPDVPHGRPVLLAQCAAAQAIDPHGGVLVELSGLDRMAGWKHREYRQVLAWLLCDLQARTAGHVALAGPFAAAIYNDELSPLHAQVADVANAYLCRILDTAPLSEAAFWEIQPGLLGTSLNAKGRAARDALYAPWLNKAAAP